MDISTLKQTIQILCMPGKGILAADESTNTIGKRFASINVDNQEAHRRDYRQLLLSTSSLEKYVSGVILFEETLAQKDVQGTALPQLLLQRGILPGVKVDQGLIPLINANHEQVTQGLDGLTERLQAYLELGAKFTKWRAVFNITESTPSDTAIQSNCELLARYAATCQSLNLVPIVEPELLMDGNHNIDSCAYHTSRILEATFKALNNHQVKLPYIILKPNMVLPGKDCAQPCDDQTIAQYTVKVLHDNVPGTVPGINFLSGGQTPEQATTRLNAMNQLGPHPWMLSFSYGRALQEDCLKAWHGNPENVGTAQQVLLSAAQKNSEAAMGQLA